MGRHHDNTRVYSRFEPQALEDAVHGACLEHRLLGAGDLAIRLRGRVGPRFAVDAADHGCAVYQHGPLHPAALTVAFAPDREGTVHAQGRLLPPQAVLVHAEGAVADWVSGDAVGWRVVTVPRDTLQHHAERRLGRPLALPATDAAQYLPDPALTRQLGVTVEDALGTPAGVDDVALLDALTEALADAPCLPEPRSARTRRRVLEVVESVARRGAQSAEVDAAALSRLCAASERLVEQAMREGVGMPPKRWLTMARLNRVYAELADPDNTRSVTDTALHWGFNHLGRFASTYRGVFAESPSDTVARVRGDGRPRLTSRVAAPALA